MPCLPVDSDYDLCSIYFLMYVCFVQTTSRGEVPALQLHSVPANSPNQLCHCDAQWFSFICAALRLNSSRLFLALLSTATVTLERRGVKSEQGNECVHRQVRLTPLEFLQQRCTFIQLLTRDISQMLLCTFSSFSARNCHFDPPSV